MHILVTGSAGHLGEALMRTLRAQGRPAVGLDLVPSPFTDHVGSIADSSFVERAMAGVHAVVHTATLHKPHVATHSRQDFIDTNITGTLNLLEAAASHGVAAFVYTSTTSAYGDALTPADGEPAVWIDEDVVPVVKNIYGATKLAAEDLCRLFHRNQRMPCLVLRTSRFFPEPDDSPAKRNAFVDANLKANEFLYRRADVQDIVEAHLLAVERAPLIGFGRYILSATTPFTPEDLAELRAHAPAVVARRVPGYEAEYARRGWRMFPGIERVYDNTRAREALGWKPRYDFSHVLERLRADEDPRSPLAQSIGTKGYHAGAYADGLYPVES
ncbi:NAD-dependent epimerase/dehydratase family protein [Lysobacter niastensis]|uniref:NAD(P)-dependent oxidoreductase n=1 Tax=Lysobacter niastensis TaxID=380629 RepID=A0ABS0B6G4_9GAMM|nr:NAD(P)-dependent oxidoreductase [Lysobacter niastensis]MBF6024605.1 NAD(P)-dependent oxidoreductase [Lysobacter niastensis]